MFSVSTRVLILNQVYSTNVVLTKIIFINAVGTNNLY